MSDSDSDDEIVQRRLKMGDGKPYYTFDRPHRAYTKSHYAAAGRRKRLAYAGAGLGHAHVEESIFDADANGPNACAGAEVTKTSSRALAKAEVGSVSYSVGLGTTSLFEAEAKGPNASAEYKVSNKGFKAEVNAEVGSVSYSVGPAGSLLKAEAKGPYASAGYEVSNKGINAMARAEMARVSASAGRATASLGLSADTGFGIGESGVGAMVLGTGFNIGPQTRISLFGSGFEIDFTNLF